MNGLVSSVIESIDFLYVILCNTVTWLVIECLSATRLRDSLHTWVKRIIATCVAVSLGAVMYYGFNRNFEAMFYGFFIQYLSWDYFFKALVERVRNVISGKRHNQ